MCSGSIGTLVNLLNLEELQVDLLTRMTGWRVARSVLDFKSPVVLWRLSPFPRILLPQFDTNQSRRHNYPSVVLRGQMISEGSYN